MVQLRTVSCHHFMKYDIVLTTYGTLAVEEAWEDSPVKKMEWPFLIKSYWQSLIQRPLGQGNKSGLSRLQVKTIFTSMLHFMVEVINSYMLSQVLMATISLRRTKEKSLIGLPPKNVRYMITWKEKPKVLSRIL